jgi:biopolymer transport protein ExbB/TolQ
MSSNTLPTPPSSSARRSSGTLAALLVGLPLAAALLALFHFGPLRHSKVFRYVEYPVQWVEVCFFCVGMGALALRWLSLRAENAACSVELLPRWDGKPLPATGAHELLAGIARQPERIRETLFGRRLRTVLEFISQRQSAVELDDQLRSLADADAVAQDNSFGLIRFITWAIPILGFLGTVVGITGAISGVTPEQLEHSMSAVTDGLGEAFDSTALALGLTMLQMFVAHLVERQEQSLLANVDSQVERHLAHRFQRQAVESSPVLEAVRRGSEGLSGLVEAMVRKQADVWAAALGEPEKRASAIYQQVQAQFSYALGQSLEQTAEAYAQRLAALEKQSLERMARILHELNGLATAVRDTGREQQETLCRVADGIAGQADVMGKLQRDAGDLARLQAALHENLDAITRTGNFEEAVHSLNAAVHLLTARAMGQSHHGPAGRAA